MRPRSKRDRERRLATGFVTSLFLGLACGCGSELGSADPVRLSTWVAGSALPSEDGGDKVTATGAAAGPDLLGLSTETPVAGEVEVRGNSSDPEPGSTGEPQPPGRSTRLYPWFEFCTGSVAEAEVIIQLCISMQAWTDGAIVVTQPGGEWIYRELGRRAPKLEILPGARVVMFEPTRGLDDPLRWEAVAAFVHTVQDLTGAQRFVLEVEYPLYGYWEGIKVIDLEGLAAGLRRLPAQVDYVWYPAGLANGHQGWLREATPRALALWRAIQSALPRVMFTAVGPANTPHHDRRPWEQINDDLLRSEGRRTMDSVYIGDSYPGIWPLADAREAISLVRTPEAYIWCPIEDWPALSALLAQPHGQ